MLQASKPASRFIGRLPADLHVLILTHLSIPDVARYARVSRAAQRVANDEKLWETRWVDLGVDRHKLGDVLDTLESSKTSKGNERGDRGNTSTGPATIAVSSLDDGDDDDFGDFESASANQAPQLLLDLTGDTAPLNHVFRTQSTTTFRGKYIRAHTLLVPLLPSLDSSAHAILASIASTTPSLSAQGCTLHLLTRFLSPAIKPVSSWDIRLALLKTALDRFDAGLLSAFDMADTEGNEERMAEAAAASWQVWLCLHPDGAYKKGGGSMRDEWEMGRTWAEKREVLYEQGKWDPLANITKEKKLDFTAMDAFMSRTLAALQEDGAIAMRVFPPESGVLLAYAERLAGEVVGEYISPLLSETRNLGTPLFLSAAAACFREAWRVVDGLSLVASHRSGNPPTPSETKRNSLMINPPKREAVITREQAEDVIFKMFEPHMDDYLDDELDELKRTFESICRQWDASLARITDRRGLPFVPPLTFLQVRREQQCARFLDSQNPALAKRNVLASFTDVLLLPVTIVPRAVGAGVGALGTNVGSGLNAMGTGVVQGISMLNPQRWMGTGADSSSTTTEAGYKSFVDDGSLFEIGEDEGNGGTGETEATEEAQYAVGEDIDDEAGWGEISASPAEGTDGAARDESGDQVAAKPAATRAVSKPSRRMAPPTQHEPLDHAQPFAALDLLLSLDVSLELIHASRDALKRLETFSTYPRPIGTRVRETLEDVFCEMLSTLSTRHIARGFGIATERMMVYKPAEHQETTSVAPLLQFFELVHIGDTIQSMVQLFFDKEMASYIDRTDFLNAVVREKKRFENSLDDCVAAGLNGGTQALMNQVEHIIITRTKPREYYPQEDALLDLGPTQGCTEAIKCLESHCKLLRGSTSREVLEVFYQEVGIRLLAILQKHIKRQIISLSGGFQVIADLNAYHAFIASLKVPAITAEFDHLKMLGHVFIVADAKDLAQIVRDVTRYGGAYRPEDVYEFIQRRSDWKKIEKTVDKTMYNLSFKEDCVVC
ncbi:exocyst complex component Sec10-domain-containing protein [Pisolithus orientalis]|uniref:exocyst complex component Sec10-domain-containing protein n=1 Tax=Pisolithus orientalis TaxID=936130 RepID=UPI0022242FD4|nr:exocyst complex component Sec10-domain-containing protein [Pisolithus orientalis]KAI6015237.1 exocyst complex component Sec10-domain-containing protein [Pisolithus orientalis]